MLRKRTLVAALAGLNALLLGALLMQSYSLPTAHAQAKARAGDYACVTAKAAGQSFDVVYVLDKPSRKLHAFYPSNPQASKYGYGQYRDLAADFGN